MALDIAREAEAEEAAIIAQAEEDARAVRDTRAREDMVERPAPVADNLLMVDGVNNERVNAGEAVPGGRNGGRRQRNAFPARPPAEGAANAVRGHERNRAAGNAGVQARPALVVEDREQAELQRFVELALRDEEDAWDSDDLGDDDEGFVIQ